jgi:uncharacterized protein
MKGRPFASCLWRTLSLAALPATVSAQSFPLTSADIADSAAMERSAPRLAQAVLGSYRDTNRLRFLDNRFRLELLAGRISDAARALAQARALRDTPGSTPAARAANVQFEIYVRARTLADSDGRPFADAFAQAFRERFAKLDDAAAAFAARTILVPGRIAANDLFWAAPNQSGRTVVSLEEALTFLRIYSNVAVHRAFARLPASLVAEDEARRFEVQNNIAVKTADGATVCAVVARPRASASGRLPALLQFTIYADSIGSVREAVRIAANGYVGVTGHSRGKACSPDTVTPYVHDGADAAALVDWIAAHPWTDGRVGMIGGSYNGFTAWAAMKQMPKALKAIMVGAPVAPGIDVPMEGNVFLNFVYPWPFFTMNDRWLDSATYGQNQRWNGLYRQWYRSGRPYRELAAIDGTPNPGFADWLAHPTLDEYWTAMVPHGREFAAIDIPVLTTYGYFFGGPGGGLHYYIEHTRENPRAQHYLLMGPWDHGQAQRGVVTPLGDTATFIAGYEIDPAARIDILASLRYQWFDWILKGGPRPALLRDRVNYQLMGANEWRSAPSLTAAASGRLRLHLNPARVNGRYSLTPTPASTGSVTHTVNLADRSDLDRAFVGGLQAAELDTANGVVFMSEPLQRATEVVGVLSGRLELVTNKRDFDFTITLYELRADGQYFQLAPYSSRASHVESLTTRRLLTPGQTARLTFSSRLRFTARQFAPGSRVVIVIAVNKGPGQQINYGTGQNVSDESVADAGEPVLIRWLPGSYVDIPVRH